MKFSTELKIACPKCGGNLKTVKDSRPTELRGIATIRRRRECETCGKRELTYEITDAQIDAMRREIARDMATVLLSEIVK